MRKTIQVIKCILYGIFYLLYIFIYLFCCKETKRKINLDIESILKKKANILWLIYELKYDCYFKTLFFHRTKRLYLSRLLYHDNTHDFYIPYDVIIGENIMYNHPYGTILNAKSIGNNFKFKHLTTIGNKNDDESMRPIILNNVTLGANVTIIGKIVIGNNVTIGAGTVVTKDIPDNSIVVGQSIRII